MKIDWDILFCELTPFVAIDCTDLWCDQNIFDVVIDSESSAKNSHNVTAITVDFTIFAQLSDFPTANFTAGSVSTQIFALISTKLNTSVSTGSFTTLLKTAAVLAGATDLQNIQNITLSHTTYTTVNTATVTVHVNENSLSSGEFVGIVIGVIVFFVVLIGLLFMCVTTINNNNSNNNSHTSSPRIVIKHVSYVANNTHEELQQSSDDVRATDVIVETTDIIVETPAEWMNVWVEAVAADGEFKKGIVYTSKFIVYIPSL